MLYLKRGQNFFFKTVRLDLDTREGQASSGSRLNFTSAPIIGRYKRDEIKPSIEVATKMAELLNVSLDYRVGKTDVLLDSKIMNRITKIQRLSPTYSVTSLF